MTEFRTLVLATCRELRLAMEQGAGESPDSPTAMQPKDRQDDKYSFQLSLICKQRDQEGGQED